MGQEVDGVGAGDGGAGATLGEAADFVGATVDPDGGIGAVEELAVA